MNKKLLTLLTCLMVLVLVVISCGTKETTGEVVSEKGNEEVVVTVKETEKTETTPEEETVSPTADTPKYGGTHNMVMLSDIRGFDPVKIFPNDCTASHLVHLYPMVGDWAKGPAGTGEIDWKNGFVGRTDVLKGIYIESWEITDDTTILVNVRKGVRFQNKAPVNGREMTADDFVYSWNRAWFTPGAYHAGSVDADARPISVTALDKYTVEFKVPAKQLGIVWLLTGAWAWIYPREVIDTYGDMTDWRTMVGAGPFMLFDYIVGTSVTYTRNPDYWEKDPLHPENQLPYLNTVKGFIITDLSTRQAAFRTGKVDSLSGVSWEDGELLLRQAPDIVYDKGYGATNFIWARQDKPELPFDDIKVRQAMNMAINKQELIDDYYQGNAVMLGWPFLPTPSYEIWFTPLEEQSAAVKDLFTYNPEKAKQLLADAGYPDGFKTKVQCLSNDADFMSMISSYLADVGIDMEIAPMETSIFTSVFRARSHDELIARPGTNHWPARFLEVRIEAVDNQSYFESPVTREWYNTLCANYWNPDIVNPILKAYGPFVLEQATAIWLPIPMTYTMWWPWLQNYRGELTMGFTQMSFHVTYVWVDMDMKRAMGY